MKFTSTLVDVSNWKDSDPSPVHVHEVPTGTWWVREQPIGAEDAGGKECWSECQGLLRIPLVPYLTANFDPAVAMAYAWQLGFLSAKRPVGNGQHVLGAHVVIGSPLKAVDGPRYRFWLGFALQIG